jgi:GntR family transcriptional regulator
MEPLYRTAYRTILDRIAAGTYPPGGMLPSEFELGADLGVSPGTARKALSQLEAKNIVRRRQGRGTFVTVHTPEESLFHFFRLRDGDGRQVVPVLRRERIARRAATDPERTALHDAPAEVFAITRIREAGGRPICRERSVVPVPLFPGLADRAPLPNTMYSLFQQSYGCVIIAAEDSLAAGVADEGLAADLEVAPGTPVLRSERRSFDLLDRLVELRESLYLTDAARYVVRLE